MDPLISHNTYQYAVTSNEDKKFVENQILSTIQGATNSLTLKQDQVINNSDNENKVESLRIQVQTNTNSETEKINKSSDETSSTESNQESSSTESKQEENKPSTSNEPEKTLNRDEILPHEETKNPEWFDGKPAKTPERYKSIRNYILDYWQEHKPNYVSKTNIRRTMKNPGDVNAVGRVHHYLESNGYINVNCPVTATQRPKKIARKPRRPVYEYRARSSSPNYVPRGEPKNRKRKSNLATWDDPDLTRRRGSSGKRKRGRNVSYNLVEGEYNPYELVEMEQYYDENPPPFKVHVKSEAMIVMDFHSHLILNEIIGLLGGTFETKENGEKVLTVECVFPCKSIGTNIQCEMEPNSEMQAREWLEKKGYRVVGWYHSHPSFLASPSIRDIETQMSYQELFKDKETQDEPFIGIIVNPYENNGGVSEIAYVHISNEVDPEGTYRLPYSCDKDYLPSTGLDTTEMMATFEGLVHEYKFHQEKVDMSSKSNHNSNIEKLLASLDQFIHLDEESSKAFKNDIENLVRTKFMNTTDN
ncbi:unnamed protein product [Cunninghamella blakesleeana]